MSDRHRARPEQDERFQALQQQYLSEVETQLSLLEGDLRSGSGGVSDRDTEGRFRELIHNLRGSGGGYGFPAISDRARELEDRFVDGAPLEELRAGLDALAATVRESATCTTPPLVLLIDDDRMVGVLVRHALSAYRTERVGSCGEALSRLAQEPRPDLVLLDNHLPDGLGSELIPTICATVPSVPVVLLTAAADRLAEAGLASGAAQVVSKPFEVKALAQVVARILEG